MTLFLGHNIIDLSHILQKDSPTWSGGCGFHLENLTNYGEDLFCVQQLQQTCSMGTHMDAPAHLFPEGLTIDQLPLNALMAPLAIIDITPKVQGKNDYGLTVADIRQDIQTRGPISKGSFVFIRSGWSKRFHDADSYRNLVGSDHMVFPYCTHEAAAYLMEIGIRGLGIDTLSPDGGMMIGEFPVHHLLLGAGCIIVENLNNLELVPARGAYGQMLPVKFAGTTEASVRPLAYIPDIN